MAEAPSGSSGIENKPTSSAAFLTSSSQLLRAFHRFSSQERRASVGLPKTDSKIGGTSEVKLTPFYLRWSFGANRNIPVINLTLPTRSLIFYASSHAGVLYDYKMKEMRLLQGHQHAIASISSDSSGRWVVTVAAGEDSVINVWDTKMCIPIRTIFNYKSGARLAGISPDGKYLVVISNESYQTVSFWLWTYEKEEAEDEITLEPEIGKLKKIVFNPCNPTQSILMSDNQVVFTTWQKAEEDEMHKIDVHIPQIKPTKCHGIFTDLTYLNGTHQALVATSNGYVIVWSDVSYVDSFLPNLSSNKKKQMKAVHLQTHSINVICSVDNLVVTGSSVGHIRFYDNHLLLLYWCQDFTLSSITSISFNLAPRQYVLKEPEELITDSESVKKASSKILSSRSLHEEEHLYKHYEELYRNMVPLDATLESRPFISRDFVVSTDDGKIGLVNFIKNTCEFILQKSEAFISALDVHPEKKHVCIGNKAGTIFLYNYKTKELLTENKIPFNEPGHREDEDTSESYKIINYLKYDPAGYMLACGMADGSLWFLHPTLLTPMISSSFKHVSSVITKICFSPDSKFVAHTDEGMRVCVYRCENIENCEWVFLGKQRSHYKPIRDILFGMTYIDNVETQSLFSLGEDRMLVEYDLFESSPDDLKILNTERIEQSAIPLCMAWYPKVTEDTHLFTANNEFKYKLLNIKTKMCEKTALGPTFGSPIHLIQTVTVKKDVQETYILFACSKYIGIQTLPVDGNPFKSVGIVGHPVKIIQICASPDGKYLFTIGENDFSLHMWYVNFRAADVMVRIGGEGLHPYFNLIEGGETGWLFQEIKDLFYYAQILHQGENTTAEREASNKIPLCEIADLMRAIGFYPSEYEIENMMHEVSHNKMTETKNLVDEIDFEDFVRLYINHHPAFGVSADQLKKAFDTFADKQGLKSVMERDTFIELLQEKGECFSKAQTERYLTILTPIEKWKSEGRLPTENEIDLEFDKEEYIFIPEEFTYTDFTDDILGITLSPPKEEKCEPSTTYEN